jgi:hypothetical protein
MNKLLEINTFEDVPLLETIIIKDIRFLEVVAIKDVWVLEFACSYLFRTSHFFVKFSPS